MADYNLNRRLPPIRACLFDMDGLLIDSEDIYTFVINQILHEYGKPNLPWSIKAQLQGRPQPQSGQVFQKWAQLPISQEELQKKIAALQRPQFPKTQPLPGVMQMISNLSRAASNSPPCTHCAGHLLHYNKFQAQNLPPLEPIFPVPPIQGHRGR
ncbi:HAD superfamily hydrolase [Trichophyton equinum CBS 127.97]|uniref:HAD superfamily hydrolase n=1 Tax=Trichophyton equinum (strain ATCC MYA-4606 / CBS 127.97) TaxID=559882 RepID=F2Q578_TRIEC|nr:HAD superfamily hydrolase [Trichophyton equinum CBS 127.97]